METNALLDRLASGKLTRRELIGTLASVGLSLVAIPLVSRRVRAAVEPLIFERRGYEVPELYQDYIDNRGGMPKFAFFDDDGEALQKLRSGFRADTVHPCIENTLHYVRTNVVRPLDRSRLAHWDDLWQPLKSLDALWHGGDLFMIPFDWGNSSILYRADLVDIEEESWSLLWDERYKGRMASFDSISNIIVSGLVTGAKDPFAMTPAELDVATEKVKKQRELMAFYWTGISNVEQALATGDLVAAYAWNEGLASLKAQGVPVCSCGPRRAS